MLRHYTALLTILFFTGQLFAQSFSLDKESITKRVSNYAQEDEPGFALGVVQDGEIVFEFYYGYANLEHQTKVGSNTRFNIASNAKQYTAFCILQLEEEGLLNLDDDIRTYVPELYQDIEEKISIAQLINHSSGIRDYCDLMALQGKSWWKQFIDNDDAIDLLKNQKALNFKPGTAQLYSNSNYIILTEIIEKVTGKKFADYTSNFFETLEMNNTAFQNSYSMLIPNRASPYGKWSGWRQEPSITGVHGDGALYTTLADQLKWEQIIQQNDGSKVSSKLIDKSQSLMESSIEDYGYGLMFDNYEGLEHTWHDGATGAYNASFVRCPNQKLAVVAMTNNRNIPANIIVWQLTLDILEFKKRPSYPANPESVETLSNLEELVGNYQDDQGGIIKIKLEEGQLYREFYQRERVNLINDRGALFEYETIEGLKMNFRNIGKTNQEFTLYRSSQKPNTYKLLSESDLSLYDKTALNASFYNEETDTKITLKHLEGNSYSLTKNGRKRDAELIVEDYLRMMDVYKIYVIRDDKDRIVGLSVTRDRIKNVIFDRL